MRTVRTPDTTAGTATWTFPAHGSMYSDKYERYIFTPDHEHREYEQAYPWLRSNFDHPDVIKVGWDDVAHLRDAGFLDKVNEANGSMLGHHEDDWIDDPEVMRTIVRWMHERATGPSELENRVRRLLLKALEQDSYVYFVF